VAYHGHRMVQHAGPTVLRCPAGWIGGFWCVLDRSQCVLKDEIGAGTRMDEKVLGIHHCVDDWKEVA
jgi:hypothetical protein